MRMRNNHYSNYLISVQFDKHFLPNGLSGMVERCMNFLEDLGNLARKNGKRLHATFSVASGQNGAHAHFAPNWLPLDAGRKKTAKNKTQQILRYAVIKLLEENFFYVDNPSQAIKRITHDKKHVTDYVIHQPKDGQTALYDAFYIHPDFIPVYTEQKMRSYCTKQQMSFSKRPPKNGCNDKLIAIGFMASSGLIAISFILLSLF